MKNWNLLLVLLIIFCFCFAGKVQQHHATIIKMKKAAANGGLSDNFDDNELTGWTTRYGSWAAAGQELTPTSAGYNTIRYDTALSSITHWVEIEFDAWGAGDYLGVAFRMADTSGKCYVIRYYEGSTDIKWLSQVEDGEVLEEVQTYSLDLAPGDRLKAAVSGTSNATEVAIYINDLLETTLTNNPSAAYRCNDGLQVGAWAYETNAVEMDNWSADDT